MYTLRGRQENAYEKPRGLIYAQFLRTFSAFVLAFHSFVLAFLTSLVRREAGTIPRLIQTKKSPRLTRMHTWCLHMRIFGAGLPIVHYARGSRRKILPTKIWISRIPRRNFAEAVRKSGRFTSPSGGQNSLPWLKPSNPMSAKLTVFSYCKQ